MPERVTVTLGGERLPSEFRSVLTARPLEARRYRVTVEELEETDDDKREVLRATLTARIGDMRAGAGIDGEEALTRLVRDHFPDR